MNSIAPRSRRRKMGPHLPGQNGIGRQYEVWPLERLGVWHQFQIACEVSEDRPPGRWLGYELCQFPSRAWSEWHWQRGIDPAGIRPFIPKALRARVYARDGHRCLHCGSSERLSLDHIHPYSLGGDDTFENLQTLCTPCNSKKGARV